MASLSNQNDSWQCSTYIQYHHKSINNISHWAKYPLISLLISTFLFLTYSIIHDYSLLNHKHNLSMFISYPRTSKEFLTWKYFQTKTQCNSNCIKYIFIIPIAIISIILLFIDTLYVFICYPLIGCYKGCNFTRRVY